MHLHVAGTVGAVLIREVSCIEGVLSGVERADDFVGCWGVMSLFGPVTVCTCVKAHMWVGAYVGFEIS